MTRYPKCACCGKELVDWQGNVMVKESDYARRKINSITVWCKECTKEHDRGKARDLHNIWELWWIKNTFGTFFGMLMNHLSGMHGFKWSPDATEKIHELVKLTHPKLMSK